MDEYVELARKAIEEYVRSGRVINLPEPLPDIFKKRNGVFVSIKKFGELRGCIGTFMPIYDNLAEEIIYNAISSATKDPRFPPIGEDELKNIIISVDILSEPEEVSDITYLDPKKYGLILQTEDGRRGLLLPDLEGVDTVEEQMRIVRLKAGIMPDEDVIAFRFTVERHK
ncbi:MAG: AmmeMemoRadiSam system protein A [bacterium]